MSDLTANSSITHEPATHSHLTRGQSVSEEVPPDVRGIVTGSEDAKED